MRMTKRMLNALPALAAAIVAAGAALADGQALPKEFERLEWIESTGGR